MSRVDGAFGREGLSRLGVAVNVGFPCTIATGQERYCSSYSPDRRSFPGVAGDDSEHKVRSNYRGCRHRVCSDASNDELAVQHRSHTPGIANRHALELDSEVQRTFREPASIEAFSGSNRCFLSRLRVRSVRGQCVSFQVGARQKVRTDHLQAIAPRLVRAQHQPCCLQRFLDHRGRCNQTDCT